MMENIYEEGRRTLFSSVSTWKEKEGMKHGRLLFVYLQQKRKQTNKSSFDFQFILSNSYGSACLLLYYSSAKTMSEEERYSETVETGRRRVSLRTVINSRQQPAACKRHGMSWQHWQLFFRRRTNEEEENLSLWRKEGKPMCWYICLKCFISSLHVAAWQQHNNVSSIAKQLCNMEKKKNSSIEALSWCSIL